MSKEIEIRSLPSGGMTVKGISRDDALHQGMSDIGEARMKQYGRECLTLVYSQGYAPGETLDYLIETHNLSQINALSVVITIGSFIGQLDESNPKEAAHFQAMAMIRRNDRLGDSSDPIFSTNIDGIGKSASTDDPKDGEHDPDFN